MEESKLKNERENTNKYEVFARFGRVNKGNIFWFSMDK